MQPSSFSMRRFLASALLMASALPSISASSSAAAAVDYSGTLNLTSRQSSGSSSGGIALSGLLDAWTPPLSTRGRYIVDANGQRFRLQGGNWHGASGTYLGSGDINKRANHHAGEVAYQTVLCLDRMPIDDIVDSFLELGINTVRLPFSNQMIHETTVPPDSALAAANPQLRGMTPLQIYDATVAALTRKGIAVILNNHTNKNRWCCGADQNSRWNSLQTTARWESDWVFMAKRYKNNKRVVGVDLYNEVRRDIVHDPLWGGGGQYDWWQASLETANRILREANPDLLVVIEGINFVGIPLDSQPHGRPMLLPVRELSHALPVQDKLVYSAHFYAYIGPNNTGALSGPLVTRDPLFRDFSASELSSRVSDLAEYVATALNETQMHYTAPVWISEFGVGGRPDTDPKDRSWFRNFVQILVDYDLDYAFWPLVGWHKYGLGDGWALNAWDENGQRLSILDAGDWRSPSWTALQSAQNVRRGKITEPTPPVFRMLAPDWGRGGAQQSTAISNDISWHPGDARASCPDGLRLIGLSRSTRPRGLCTDASLGRELWNFTAQNNVEYVADERHVPRGQDWASGLTKFQCAPDSFVIGYSYTTSNGRSASAICAPISNPEALTAGQPTGNRTVSFSGADSISVSHGQWAPQGTRVGACADDELLVGYAADSTTGLTSVLLCRTFNSTVTIAQTTNRAAGSRTALLLLSMRAAALDGLLAAWPSLTRSAWMATLCVVLFLSC
ncbi:hypothetical protein V8E36_000016 [Tilletia maclaganii]